MALNRIWVYAEAADGKVAPITLEMLTKARELGDTVEAVYGGGDADAIAETLGAHGATKVYATGDLGGSLPGVPVASAMAKLVGRRQRPRPHHVRHHLRRPRRRRPPVGGARQAGPHQQHRRSRVDGDAVVVTEPVFGGTKLVRTRFTAAGPHIALFRPKSFAAEESGGGAAEVVTDRGARLRHRPRCTEPPRRGGHRARSSTRPTSSSPVAGASARPTSTR